MTIHDFKKWGAKSRFFGLKSRILRQKSQLKSIYKTPVDLTSLCTSLCSNFGTYFKGFQIFVHEN